MNIRIPHTHARLCVTGCSDEVAKLEWNPESEIVNPLLDLETWEQERLHNR